MLNRNELERSIELFRAGQFILSAGASSPLATFREVDSPALVIHSAKGCTLTDIDRNRYVDFVLGLGSLILGHRPESVVKALRRQILRGTVYVATTEIEYVLADTILRSVPCLDRIRFVCSGTEAVMTALRVAKRVTGRQTLLKFRGCYHGHSDPLLGSDFESAASPSRRGRKPKSTSSCILVDYNDVDQMRETFDKHGEHIAAAVVEPIACNMGLVKPTDRFLPELRRYCDKHGALLIFDEVVSGYRFRFGSVSSDLGVQPDLIAFGKVIGGGLPVGAYGGRACHMKVVEDQSGVFPGGTFAGNPLSMTAGAATLAELRSQGCYQKLEDLGHVLEDTLIAGFARKGMPYGFSRKGSVGSFVFTDDGSTIRSFRDLSRINRRLYGAFHWEMLRRGYFLGLSADEPLFLCLAHTEAIIERFAKNVIDAVEKASLDAK
jgi:glutamate-1-semialdehyde 2,1-aminomutase